MCQINFKVVLLFLFVIGSGYSQKLKVVSPNAKIEVSLYEDRDNGEEGAWYLKIGYKGERTVSELIPRIDLGIKREDEDFSKNLKFVKASKEQGIEENYTTVHGKQLIRNNKATEVSVSFKNDSGRLLNLLIRAYDDGLAFRYGFPEKIKGDFLVKEEITSYTILDSTSRWLQKYNPANEGYYRKMKDGVTQADWAYPALFHTVDTTAWFLISEAGLERTYAGTKLSNTGEQRKYKTTFPDAWNARGQGERLPTITLPWQSPWRVIIVGGLEDIVASTLVDDVSAPSTVKNTDWIKPGLVSWNYWSDNHGTRDYQVVTKFADLAAEMGWRYTLLDWEWDVMGNGGKLEDAIDYIHNKGVTPLIWYNSGGDHTWVGATPKDRMLTHENRMEEFARLKKMGIAGVKVDFFESEKQDMIAYYLDILDDAAQFEIMVYFHGCLVPRGWGRTYPHLMTYEAVRGAEWYNNVPDFTFEAPVHNTILPFTRNVVGAMDYTPVTFTNSQHPHITSYGHELALAILFESPLQHMADRPEGYQALPVAAKFLISDLPTAWDGIKLLDGYPGKDVILARQSGEDWYVGGINAEDREKTKNIPLSFLRNDSEYKLIIIKDGSHDKELQSTYRNVISTDSISVKMLRRGGFAAHFKKR